MRSLPSAQAAVRGARGGGGQAGAVPGACYLQASTRGLPSLFPLPSHQSSESFEHDMTACNCHPAVRSLGSTGGVRVLGSNGCCRAMPKIHGFKANLKMQRQSDVGSNSCSIPESISFAQVFEYLDTDLKKFMDRNGKGIINPMAPQLIKVRNTSRDL